MSERIKVTFRLEAETHARLQAASASVGLNAFLVHAVEDALARAEGGASTLPAPCQHPASTLINTDVLPASTPRGIDPQAPRYPEAGVDIIPAGDLTPYDQARALADAERLLIEKRAERRALLAARDPYEPRDEDDEETSPPVPAPRPAPTFEAPYGERPALPPAPKPPACAACARKQWYLAAEGKYTRAARCPDCLRPCPACADTGAIIVTDARGNDYAQDCACRVLAARIRRFNAAEIPARYAGLIVGALPLPAGYAPPLEQLQAIQSMDRWARTYRRGKSRGVVLWGSVGTRKTTHLCRALTVLLLSERIRRPAPDQPGRGEQCRFVSWERLLLDIKESWREEGAENPILPLTACPVLAVDEVGSEDRRPTDWQAGQLDLLLSDRYNAGYPTLLTTNRTPAELRALLGARLSDRLTETTDFLHFPGPSIRPALGRRPPREPQPEPRSEV
jgi:DNA replication protein DnaC